MVPNPAAQEALSVCSVILHRKTKNLCRERRCPRKIGNIERDIA